MSSLAEFIPMELVNHILSFRPRHPVAELIKKYKERLTERINHIPSFRNFYNTLTFKDLHDPSTFGLRIFSREIVPNCIYKIKTKKYKNSEWVYWGKYYTLKQADKEFEKAKKHFCEDIYGIELVNIYNDSLIEYTEEYYIYYYSASDNDSDEEDEDE